MSIAFTLDHLGLIVPSLTKASALFADLGFTLTRRADHTRVNARGEVESAGSSQCSIMFGEDYLELQEQTGPPGEHPLSPAADKHFGLHIVAVGVPDAQAAQPEIVRRGLPAGPAMEWTRPIDEEDRSGTARFGFIAMPYSTSDECFLCWVEQKTPDLVRSPRLMNHANGAVALGGLVISIPDGADARLIAARHVAAGAEAVEVAAARAVLSLGVATTLIERRGALKSLGLDHETYRGARVSALALRFADPASFGARAAKLGLDVRRWRNALAINLGPDYEAIILAEQA
jgi:hypothetical protein